MNINKIIREFKRIKDLGFLLSRRSHNTGIGKTFEDYLSIKENNLKNADFEGFEVKSHREFASSKITLFTKSPTNPKGANNYLRQTFGRADESGTDDISLHTSVFGSKYNSYNNAYGFKLKLDENQQRIYLLVKDLNSKKIISNNVYYSFQDIEKATFKLLNLFVVYAESRIIDGKEHFHFINAEVYLGFNVNKLIELIPKGIIQYDIRIGTYKSGKNQGKTHDHGSGFRVAKNDLKLLYDKYFKI